MPRTIELSFVSRPHVLPPPPASGRVVVLDIAFANSVGFERITRPFIDALGDRLALWIDHHDHAMWPAFAASPCFLLVGKLEARACPQLVTPEVVRQAGKVDAIVAHADFDGCMSAAKFLRGGESPYAEADEDARFADAPGQGFTCSARGWRLCQALDGARAAMSESRYHALLEGLAWSLVDSHEPDPLRLQLDTYAQQRDARIETLRSMLAAAKRPHPDILVLAIPAACDNSDKKYLLREMEQQARIAIIEQGKLTTVATFDDGADGLDLDAVRGLQGQRGYAWGHVSAADLLPRLAAALRQRG